AGAAGADAAAGPGPGRRARSRRRPGYDAHPLVRRHARGARIEARLLSGPLAALVVIAILLLGALAVQWIGIDIAARRRRRRWWRLPVHARRSRGLLDAAREEASHGAHCRESERRANNRLGSVSHRTRPIEAHRCLLNANRRAAVDSAGAAARRVWTWPEHAGFDAHAPLQVPHAAHRPSAPRRVQHAAALTVINC